MRSFSVSPHPAEAVCDWVLYAGSVSNVHNVVAENGLHPSTVVGVEFVLEEAVAEGLTVRLDFDW